MRTIKNHDTIIIGAGISGLTSGKYLKRDFKILEKENVYGGLSTQYLEKGYKFCYGGHYFHFKDKKNVWDHIKKYSKFNKYIKNSKAFVVDKFVPFPIQFHLSFFPKALRDSFLNEIIKNKKSPMFNFNNIEEYLLNTFGTSLYKVFFYPFLTKYYGLDLKTLAHSMDKGSIPVPDLKEVLDGYHGKRFKSLGYNPVFYYPDDSLISFIENYSTDLQHNIIKNEEVIEIDMEKKFVYTKNNKYQYKTLVNTMPLKEFLKISNNSNLKQNIEGLKNISTIVSNIVLKKRRKRFHWVYLPDRRYPFYRFGYYPGNKNIVAYLERTVSLKRDIISNENGIEPIYKILKMLGIVNNRSEIEYISNKYIPVSYIIFDNEWKNIVPPTLKILKEKDIYSIGRYGSWDYTSMSDDILQSIKTAEEINYACL